MNSLNLRKTSDKKVMTFKVQLRGKKIQMESDSIEHAVREVWQKLKRHELDPEDFGIIFVIKRDWGKFFWRHAQEYLIPTEIMMIVAGYTTVEQFLQKDYVRGHFIPDEVRQTMELDRKLYWD